ncbi:MAG: SRPBCC family protein [Bauldia sp.]
MFKWLTGGKRQEAEAAGGRDLLIVSRTVEAAIDRAFAVFVDNFNDWWPRDATWGGDKLAAIGIEAKPNGRCFERTVEGTESVWGTVLTLSRPDHIVIAWQIKADRTPEEGEATASRVDVRFVETNPGTTEVVLVHRDFPRHGDGWEKYRATMAAAKGWPRLIDLYAKAVAG